MLCEKITLEMDGVQCVLIFLMGLYYGIPFIMLRSVCLKFFFLEKFVHDGFFCAHGGIVFSFEEKSRMKKVIFDVWFLTHHHEANV